MFLKPLRFKTHHMPGEGGGVLMYLLTLLTWENKPHFSPKFPAEIQTLDLLVQQP